MEDFVLPDDLDTTDDGALPWERAWMPEGSEYEGGDDPDLGAHEWVSMTAGRAA